jgi:16S rRNA (guanine527-N7)-methyltransferase
MECKRLRMGEDFGSGCPILNVAPFATLGWDSTEAKNKAIRSTDRKSQKVYKKSQAMNTTRIAALLEPFLERPLSSSQLGQISTYIDLLLRWNARINLTAIRSEEEIVTRHFGESLFLARHLFPTVPDPTQMQAPQDVFGWGRAPSPVQAQAKPGWSGNVQEPAGVRVIDIGSGAGFPGIPLKVWAPDIHLTLIESNHKKAAFLSEVARSLNLANLDIRNQRTEVLAEQLSAHADVVTFRAVERFETILPQAAAFLASKGRLALLITSAQTDRLSALTNLEWDQPIKLPKSTTGLLSIGHKVQSGLKLLH